MSPTDIRPISNWKAFIRAAAARLDRPYLSAASAVLVSRSLFASPVSPASEFHSDQLSSVGAIAEESVLSAKAMAAGL